MGGWGRRKRAGEKETPASFPSFAERRETALLWPAGTCAKKKKGLIELLRIEEEEERARELAGAKHGPRASEGSCTKLASRFSLSSPPPLPAFHFQRRKTLPAAALFPCRLNWTVPTKPWVKSGSEQQDPPLPMGHRLSGGERIGSPPAFC